MDKRSNFLRMNKLPMFSYLVICLLASSSHAQNQDCTSYSFSNNNIYQTCNNLPVLDSFLHYTYHQTNHTVDIAYRHVGVTTSNWVAWALNPTGSGMSGSQSLVAFQNSSGVVSAHTSPISGYRTQLQPAPLSFGVPRIDCEFRSGANEMIIYATLQLPTGQTRFTQVWQFGQVSNGVPQEHTTSGDNLRSTGTVDFLSGQTTDAGSTGNSRQRKRNIHGVLNVVSWGILMPMGAIVARHMKVFKAANPAWFYLHSACQSSAYIVGVAGWGTGLKLGSDSKGVTQNPHRKIGIALFCLGTLQIFALLLRPKPDHKYRFYWNIYHHMTGYAVIVLSIVNIFEGFDILQPEEKWRRAYIGVLIFLGVFAVLMEVITWIIVLKRRKETSSEDKFSSAAGTNGAREHDNRL
ncbi:hypothetical protein LIER_35821 [Lithospermum erythrorhizon]|uniref:Cytochrome b561 and DOMON domain-containing protein n=1 Tax=Lithospermum erythrorhizon TaxID=34254 RepID=A0AAV3NX02_LITER